MSEKPESIICPHGSCMYQIRYTRTAPTRLQTHERACRHRSEADREYRNRHGRWPDHKPHRKASRG